MRRRHGWAWFALLLAWGGSPAFPDDTTSPTTPVPEILPPIASSPAPAKPTLCSKCKQRNVSKASRTLCDTCAFLESTVDEVAGDEATPVVSALQLTAPPVEPTGPAFRVGELELELDIEMPPAPDWWGTLRTYANRFWNWEIPAEPEPAQKPIRSQPVGESTLSADKIDLRLDAALVAQNPVLIELANNAGFCILSRSKEDGAIQVAFVKDRSEIPGDAVHVVLEGTVPPLVPMIPLPVDVAPTEPRKLDLGPEVINDIEPFRPPLAPPASDPEPAPLPKTAPLREPAPLPTLPAEPPKSVPTAGPVPLVHRVGYPQSSSDSVEAVTFPSAGPAVDWSISSSSRISFHFQGDSLADVGRFFHHATGMTVRIDASAVDARMAPAPIHVLVRDKSIEQSLRVVLGSCGLGYYVAEGVLTIADPAEVLRRANPTASWVP